MHGSAIRYALGDPYTSLALHLDQRVAIARDAAIELRLSVRDDFGESWLEAGLFWNRYF